MIDVTSVLATAIVRARDGSSIEDWDESSSTQPDHYIADPDRIHAAALQLEDGGLTVEAIGDFTISFSGSAADLATVFGIDVDTTDDGHPVWKASGRPSYALHVSHGLATQVVSVTLDSPPEQYRDYIMSVATDAEVLDTDLLIGEVGETLGRTLPARFMSASPTFPRQSKHLETLESIDNWKPKLAGLPRSARRGLQRPSGRTTEIRMIEGSGGLGVEELLDQYGLLSDRASFNVDRVDVDLQGIYQENNHWTTYRPRKAKAILEWLHPAVAAVTTESRTALQAYFAFIANGGQTDANEEELAVSSALVADALQVVVDQLEYLTIDDVGVVRIGPPQFENQAKQTLLDLRPSIARLNSGVTSGGLTVATARALFDDLKLKPISLLRRQLQVLVPRLIDERNNVLLQTEAHAQMVAVAVQSVTVGLGVDAELQCLPSKHARLWTERSASAGSMANVVYSASFGSPIKESGQWWPELIRSQRLRTAARLQDKRTLYILATSNNGIQGGRPSQNMAWAGCENVVLVGGCEPRRDAATGTVSWIASDATHGYGMRIGAKRFSLPDVCATTKGMQGGAMIFPTFSRPRTGGPLGGQLQRTDWRTGGGSSLSTPIAAAVAGVVWKCFPELSAADVKEVLVQSALPLTAGSFYLPSALTVTELAMIIDGSHLVAGGNAATDNPAGRVDLQGAIEKAKLKRISSEISALLHRPQALPAQPGQPAQPVRRRVPKQVKK